MKIIYLEPSIRYFGVCIEGLICLSGGEAGDDGKPGAEFDSEDGSIFDGGIY